MYGPRARSLQRTATPVPVKERRVPWPPRVYEPTQSQPQQHFKRSAIQTADSGSGGGTFKANDGRVVEVATVVLVG